MSGWDDLMSSRMALSDCSSSRARAGDSCPLYPPSLSRTHPAAGSPTARAAAPASNGGLDVTCETMNTKHVNGQSAQGEARPNVFTNS